MSYYRLCGECVLRTNETQCNIFKRNINLSDRACPGFVGAEQIDTCIICGKVTPTRQMVICPEDNISICPSCAENLGTCYTCVKAAYCDFESNPSTLPKIVQRVVQQGNMRTVTQVQNPDRIAITCQQNCACFDPEFGCMRELPGHTCGNYIIRK